MQPGQVRQEPYADEKNGSCTRRAAIALVTGQRLGLVRTQRTKKEYTEFCQALATAYPKAPKIRLGQDNLHTHNASSFYQHLPAAEAFALTQRFEFYDTPKSASWLNMIEIEFSALSRQCLDRRIPTQEKLAPEVLSFRQERSDKRIKIHWQFSVESVRPKLNSPYQRVNEENHKYQKT